jgi:hypothetical protein
MAKAPEADDDLFANLPGYGAPVVVQPGAIAQGLAVDPRQALSRADINAPPTDNLQPAGTAAAAGPPPSNWQQFGRGVGLGTRELVQGALSMPGTAIDAAGLALQPLGLPFKSSAQKTGEALTAMGLPEEQTTREKIVGGLNEGLAGVASGYGLGAALQSPTVLGALGARVLPTAARTAGPVADVAAVPSTLTAYAPPGSLPAVTGAIGQTLRANPFGQAVVGGVQGGTQAGLNAAGVNPYAAALLGIGTGALTGAAMPNISSGFANASDRALAQTAREKYNIPIDPATMAAPGVKLAFGATKYFPGSGVEGETRAAQNALNTAVGKTFGAVVGKDGKLTPEVMTAAREAAGGAFQDVAANSAPLLDKTLNTKLTTIQNNAELAGLSPTELKAIQNHISTIRQVAANNGGSIPSDWLVKTLGSKSPLSRGAAGSGVAREYFGDLQTALHDNLYQYATPGQKEALDAARQTWKNMKTVEGLVATGGGDIDPNKFAATFARNKYQRVAYTGGDPQLAELADISRRFLTPPAGLAGQVAHLGAGPLTVGAEHLLEQGASLDPLTLAGYGAKAAAITGAGAGARALLRRGALAPTPPTLPEVWARSALTAPTGGTMQFNPRLQAPVQFKQF